MSMHPQCERSGAALEFDCDDPWGLLLMWIRLQGSQLLTPSFFPGQFPMGYRPAYPDLKVLL